VLDKIPEPVVAQFDGRRQGGRRVLIQNHQRAILQGLEFPQVTSPQVPAGHDQHLSSLVGRAAEKLEIGTAPLPRALPAWTEANAVVEVAEELDQFPLGTVIFLGRPCPPMVRADADGLQIALDLLRQLMRRYDIDGADAVGAQGVFDGEGLAAPRSRAGQRCRRHGRRNYR